MLYLFANSASYINKLVSVLLDAPLVNISDIVIG
jgi:hypothetical protein